MTEEAKKATAAGGSTPAVEYNGDKPRSCIVPLDYPLTVDGVTYTEVTVRRASAREVSEYIEGLRKPGGKTCPPMIELPQVVYENLDDDDMFKIEREAEGFFPQRLKALMAIDPDAPDPS